MRKLVYTSSNTEDITDEAIGTLLLAETIRKIAELNLFKRVEVKVRSDESVQSPSCYVGIKSIDILEQNLHGRTQNTEYSFLIGIGLDSPDDAVVVQQLLAFAQRIRYAFSKQEDGTPGILLFSAIPTHFSTIIGSTPIEPIAAFDNDTILYNSGINMVYNVWESLFNE